MQDNQRRKCESCRSWFRSDEEMLPIEDKAKIPGTCNNQWLPAFSQLRLPHQGIYCTGWQKAPPLAQEHQDIQP